MRSKILCRTLFLMLAFDVSAFAQTKDSSTTLMDVKVLGVEITKAAHVEVGTTHLWLIESRCSRAWCNGCQEGFW